MNKTPLKVVPQKKTNTIVKSPLICLTIVLASLFVNHAQAQTIEQVKWKDKEEVRQLYGEPENVRGPIGTHASYIIWEYPKFSVAFANDKAIHLFRKDSLKKVVLRQSAQ